MAPSWIVDRVTRLVARVVASMPNERRGWGEAVVAEFAVIPPSDRRLRWVVGGLWFVLRQRYGPAASLPAAGRVSRVFAALGVVTVLPWVYTSILNLRDDAPDGTVQSMIVMLCAQVAVVLAFVGTWWRWRPGLALLVCSLVAYAAAAAYAAASNDGHPVMAALIYVIAPAFAATPIVLIGSLVRKAR